MSVLRGMVHPTAGPIVPVVLRSAEDADETTAFEARGYALLDTGAALSGIDEDLAIRLKLPPQGTLRMTRPGPSPDFLACRFRGQIAFPGSLFPAYDSALVGYQDLDTRFADDIRVVALLGRDWLAGCVLQLRGALELEIRPLHPQPPR